ncbi:hypothetical protein HPULCUR_006074 [Helicostylum pulchrum]|uniref:Uncharacterized protein n=1 Tax=Helicostylum pulchrum TaxID=562976 RepID=A0ABP9Y0W3_9FUNG
MHFFLPRIGMIEHNGDNFQCINMDMCFDFDAINFLVWNSTEDDLSSILSKCLNVKNISVIHTLLRKFGTGLQEQKIPFIQILKLDRLLVYDSFLRDMSFHLPFIDEFVAINCRVDGENKKNVTIDMPHTKFTEIVYYSDSVDVSKWYLKL